MLSRRSAIGQAAAALAASVAPLAPAAASAAGSGRRRFIALPHDDAALPPLPEPGAPPEQVIAALISWCGGPGAAIEALGSVLDGTVYQAGAFGADDDSPEAFDAAEE